MVCTVQCASYLIVDLGAVRDLFISLPHNEFTFFFWCGVLVVVVWTSSVTLCAREHDSPKTHLIITQKTKNLSHTNDMYSMRRIRAGQRISMEKRMRDEEEMAEIEISRSEMN